MADKEKEAYWKGHNDEKRWTENRPKPLEEACSPSYRPPEGHKEAYKAGWDSSKKDRD